MDVLAPTVTMVVTSTMVLSDEEAVELEAVCSSSGVVLISGGDESEEAISEDSRVVEEVSSNVEVFDSNEPPLDSGVSEAEADESSSDGFTSVEDIASTLPEDPVLSVEALKEESSLELSKMTDCSVD